MPDVRRGMPDADRLLTLLNEAFDGWGDEAHLRWKYDQYPGFDPDEHAVHVERDDGLAAFRRLFGKELAVGGRTVSAFGLGDTTVAEDYRGQGLYSALHETTVERCRQHGVDLVLTFNRTNNVTFAANRDRGWRYYTLPLQMKILSPERVLAEYVDLVVDEWPRTKRAIDALGDRVTLVVDGTRLPLSALGSGSAATATAEVNDSGTRSLPVPVPVPVPVPAWAVRRAVRAFGRQSKRDTLASLLWPSQSGTTPATSGKTEDRTRAVNANGGARVTTERLPTDSSGRTATATSRAGTRTTAGRAEAVHITVTDDPDDLERVRALYDAVRDDARVSFRRDVADLRHMCRYPTGRRVLLAERDGDLCGFAVLGTRPAGEVTECRVLDAVAADGETFRRLVDGIERVARRRGDDVVLLLSHRDAGPEWVHVEKQVVMWDRPDDGPEVPELAADWQVGLYDVV